MHLRLASVPVLFHVLSPGACPGPKRDRLFKTKKKLPMRVG